MESVEPPLRSVEPRFARWISDIRISRFARWSLASLAGRRPRFARLASLGRGLYLYAGLPRFALSFALWSSRFARRLGGASLPFARLEASENGTPSSARSSEFGVPEFSGLSVPPRHHEKEKLRNSRNWNSVRSIQFAADFFRANSNSNSGCLGFSRVFVLELSGQIEN